MWKVHFQKSNHNNGEMLKVFSEIKYETISLIALAQWYAGGIN